MWCRQRESHDWRAVGFRTSPHPDSEADFRAQVLGRGFKHDVHYTSLSILTTLARVVMAGATAIHLYGCDMAGAGYFAGKDPDDKTSLVWKARWKDERRQFLAFEKEFGSVCPITRK